MYYFNFEEKLEEQNGVDSELIGNPVLSVDPVTGKQCCYFDGKSGINLPYINLGGSDFTIEAIFRPLSIGFEQGIFGSLAYKLALRTDRKRRSMSMFINFPSSVTQHKMQFGVDKEGWYDKEHYFAVVRRGNSFETFFDGKKVGELMYDYKFRPMPIFIGYYYHPMYAFLGYMREFKVTEAAKTVKVGNVYVPKTLKD